LQAVKAAFYELNGRKCEDNCGKGCFFCCPLITFVVAQSQHGIRIVPARVESRKRGVANVPSGTCVDDPSMMSPPYQDAGPRGDPTAQRSQAIRVFTSISTEEKRCDFMLVSHGGLKVSRWPWSSERSSSSTFDHLPFHS